VKKIIAGLILALCLFITACSSANENAPVEYQPPADASQVAPNPPEAQSSPAALFAQRIIDSGIFSGDFHGDFPSPRQFQGFTTYTNTALDMVYHFDSISEGEDGRLFMGVFAPVAPSNGLMEAVGFGDGFAMRVIDGSGEEWVRGQADSNIERLIQMYREWDDFLREHYGEEYEEMRARGNQFARENEEFLRNLVGDEYEISFGSHNYNDMEFWPVEYEIAGRIFTGLQINAIMTGSGFNNGMTYLFHQIDDLAIVISISSEEWAGAAARRHVSRFSTIAEHAEQPPAPNERVASEPNERVASEPNERVASEPNERVASEPNVRG